MFHVFQGEDAFSCSEEIASLKARMGDPALADLNVTHLDGRTIDLKELEHHCDTIPFLGEQRLVIVRGLLARLEQKSEGALGSTWVDALMAYLPTLPSTTRLIFWEDGALSPKHPVLVLAQKYGKEFVKTFELPTGSMLADWIRKRVKDAEGQITAGAVNVLSMFVGSDLYQLDQEIAKLVAFTGGQRPIEEKDVALLTPRAREANVFEMVDALGRRDGRTASRTCHELLDAGEHPLALLGMVTRQFRLMIQVKELAPQLGTPDAIARELRQNPYPIKKILHQSASYTMAQLGAIYHRLLDADVEIKTGQMDPVLSLELLIAGLSRIS